MVTSEGRLLSHKPYKLTNLNILLQCFEAGNRSGKQEIGNYCVKRQAQIY
jgi:hypothetical protein